MYPATVFKVMIASPGDAPELRATASKSIIQWSIENSEREGIFFLPIGWETHAPPQMKPSQKVINRHVVSVSDFLIAIFHTRLGTPTDEYDSGTVEEIDRHQKSNKPVSIFMLSGEVATHDFALQQFRKKIRDEGLIGNYKDAGDLKEKIRVSLGQIICESYFQQKLPAANVCISATVVDSLSKEAQELLLIAASDGPTRGIITKIEPLFKNPYIKVGSKSYGSSGDSCSYYMSAMDDLLRKGLTVEKDSQMESSGIPDNSPRIFGGLAMGKDSQEESSEMFSSHRSTRHELTEKGFDAAARLRKKSAE